MEIKYRKVFETLKNEILCGKYSVHSTFPSVAMVIRRFGIANLTAVKVMSKLKEEGLVYSCQGRGTFVTRQGASRRIGLIVHGSDYCELFAPVSKGISQLCQRHGYTMLLGDVSSQCTAKRIRKVQTLADKFIEEGLAGVIFQPIELVPDAEKINLGIANRFTGAGIPVVLLDSDIVASPARSGYDMVAVNHLDVGRRLAEHLRAVGARRILYLTQRDRAPCVKSRQLGVRLGSEGLPVAGKAVFAEPDDVAQIRRILRRERPDAIACYNDRQAALLLQTLVRLGKRVPDDIRVAGFDDVQYAKLTIPQLTTMHQPCGEIAEAVFGLLMDRIRRPDLPAREVLLDSKLVVRGSTQRERAGRD